MPVALQFIGHATVAIEIDGVRLLTDPVLREHASALVHLSPPSKEAFNQPLDAVLISHLHHDHLDLPSLRLLPPGFRVLVPKGAGPFLARHGFPDAVELSAGDELRVGGLRMVATRADHLGRRALGGPTAETIGFVLDGSQRIYFAGDTDVFDGMRALRPIDIALLPIAGWGPRLGPGHMDSTRAVEACKLLQPRIAVPIHWGTLAPWGMHRWNWSYLTRPATDFAEIAAREVPDVDVRILQPGEFLRLGSESPIGG